MQLTPSLCVIIIRVSRGRVYRIVKYGIAHSGKHVRDRKEDHKYTPYWFFDILDNLLLYTCVTDGVVHISDHENYTPSRLEAWRINEAI